MSCDNGRNGGDDFEANFWSARFEPTRDLSCLRIPPTMSWMPKVSNTELTECPHYRSVQSNDRSKNKTIIAPKKRATNNYDASLDDTTDDGPERLEYLRRTNFKTKLGRQLYVWLVQCG